LTLKKLIDTKPDFIIPIFVHNNPKLATAKYSKNYNGDSDMGYNRYRFIYESLVVLNEQLDEKLAIYDGISLLKIIKSISGIKCIAWEHVVDPVVESEIDQVMNYCNSNEIEMIDGWPNINDITDYLDIVDPDCTRDKELLIKNSPKAFSSMEKLIIKTTPESGFKSNLGKIKLASLRNLLKSQKSNFSLSKMEKILEKYQSELSDFELELFEESKHQFPGGELEAKKRLKEFIKNTNLPNFNKPQTSAATLEPSTSGLSMYIHHGCISVRYIMSKVGNVKTKKSVPNQSTFVGQLYWREFFYFQAYIYNIDLNHKKQYHTGNNGLAKKYGYKYINSNDKNFQAWANGETGYPWIDALMIQLRTTGWIHHLGRHAVACFLTRGDLFIHWEHGRAVFDRLLIDADYPMNNANWMWLSATAYFFLYGRIYSPISFGKKMDPNGKLIRKYIPQLAEFPDKYIYEPWKLPVDQQEELGCIIGKDYPEPIVDHSKASSANVKKIKNSK